MSDNIIHLGQNAINDIPTMLRALADQINSGKQTAEAVYVIVPNPGAYPTIYGYGAYTSPEERIATLDMAKYWILREQVQETE